jgi:hypothetical protein
VRLHKGGMQKRLTLHHGRLESGYCKYSKRLPIM